MPIPDFILELRSRVGELPLWLAGARCVVLREGDDGRTEVLMLRRADNGLWDHLAGIVEPGEHPIACLEREAVEEAGVVITVDKMIGLGVTPEVTYPNGDRCQYLSHEFVARWLSGEARVNDDESLEVGWFPPDRLPEPLLGRARRLVDLALAGSGEVDQW